MKPGNPREGRREGWRDWSDWRERGTDRREGGREGCNDTYEAGDMAWNGCINWNTSEAG